MNMARDILHAMADVTSANGSIFKHFENNKPTQEIIQYRSIIKDLEKHAIKDDITQIHIKILILYINEYILDRMIYRYGMSEDIESEIPKKEHYISVFEDMLVRWQSRLDHYDHLSEIPIRTAIEAVRSLKRLSNAIIRDDAVCVNLIISMVNNLGIQNAAQYAKYHGEYLKALGMFMENDNEISAEYISLMNQVQKLGHSIIRLFDSQVGHQYITDHLMRRERLIGKMAAVDAILGDMAGFG